MNLQADFNYFLKIVILRKTNCSCTAQIENKNVQIIQKYLQLASRF